MTTNKKKKVFENRPARPICSRFLSLPFAQPHSRTLTHSHSSKPSPFSLSASKMMKLSRLLNSNRYSYYYFYNNIIIIITENNKTLVS